MLSDLTKRVAISVASASRRTHRIGVGFGSAAETVLLELQAATAVCAFLAPEKKQLREQDQKTMRVAALRRSLAAAPKPREACAPCATQSQRAKSTAVKRMPAASTGRAPLVENVRGSIYGEPQPVPTEFRNVDGERLEDGRYAAFREEATLSGAVKPENVFTDPVRTFAYGTDASFYRLIPKMVLKVETEREIQSLLKLARKHRTPVTFRAAGTSLSGQAVTDSILLKLSHTGKNWRRHAIGDEGKTITVEPGLIGGEVNRLLGSYAKRHEKDTTYRLGPDPASIDSCMIGASRRP